jgi:uncharacterized membrane protein HdeD (DUF308 family)
VSTFEAPQRPTDLTHEQERLWWMLALASLASGVIGVLILAWPQRTLEVLATLAGIYLLVTGIAHIVLALIEAPAGRTAALLVGAIAGIAGLIVIRHPGGSITFVALAIGIFLVISGVMGLVAVKDAVGGRSWLLAGAVIDLCIGVVIVSWPKFGVASFALLLGIALLLRAALEAATALALRADAHALAGAGREQAHPPGMITPHP